MTPILIDDTWLGEDTLAVEDSLKRWLTCRHSTTALMKQLSNQQLNIEVLHQGFEYPLFDEKNYLKSRPRETVFVREIFMRGGNERWMFCRTLFPKKTLTKEHQAFATLNNTSLGEVIYKNPEWVRSPFQFQQLYSEHALFKKMLTYNASITAPVWARRSHFACKDKMILIHEIFLTDLIKHECLF